MTRCILFLFFASVYTAEYVVHYCVEEQHFPHFMLACVSDDCTSWRDNCRHSKIFDHLEHALWFINGEKPQKELSVEEKEGGFFYVDLEPEFPFSSERKNARGFKFVALYETKEIPLDKKVEVEEVVTKTTKETIKYAFYSNKTS